MILLLLFGHFAQFWVFLAFWAILGLDYTAYWFEIFFWQKNRNLSKLSFLIAYPPQPKRILVPNGKDIKKMILLLPFGHFSQFWVFLAFWAILGLDYTGYWFWDIFGQNFKICQHSVFWLSTPSPSPPNIKFIIVESRFRAIAVKNNNFLSIFWTF